MAAKLSLWGVKSIKLSGGEPTVRNDLIDIIKLFAAVGLRSVLITNGIRVLPKHLQALRSHGGSIKFSIHYPDYRNDEVLGNRCFDRVTSNLRSAVEHKIDVGINCVVSRQNVSVMAPMVDFAARIGCRKISFIPLIFRGLAARDLSESDMNETMLGLVRRRCKEFVDRGIEVRLIDIRAKDYWIVENDGRLIIERDTEAKDSVIFSSHDWGV